MPRRLLPLAVLGGLLAAAAHAQPPGAFPGAGAVVPVPAKAERAVYAVKGGDPTALAEVVGLHFRGEVKVSAVGPALVLSGPAAAVAEANALLAKIDRRPRSVELEVALVEVTGKAAELPAGEVDPAKLDELAKGGSARRIRLTADEGQAVSSQTGTDKPYLSSSVIAPGFGGPAVGFGAAPGAGPGGEQAPARQPRGVVQRSVNYRPIGTTVKATSRVGADGAVAVELSVQDSTVRPAAAGDETGSPTFETASLSTRLTVPAGKAVVAQATRRDGGDGRAVTLVVVTAKVIDGGR